MLQSISNQISIVHVILLSLLAGEVYDEVLCLRTPKCGIAAY